MNAPPPTLIYTTTDGNTRYAAKFPAFMHEWPSILHPQIGLEMFVYVRLFAQTYARQRRITPAPGPTGLGLYVDAASKIFA